MKLKFLAVAAVGAAALTAASAHATTFPLTFTNGVAFGGDVVSGMFTDDYDFTVPSLTADTDTFNFAFSDLPPFSISTPGLTLLGPNPMYTVTSGTESGATTETLVATGLTAGSYDLRVAGNVSGTSGVGTYSFIAQEVTSAAPEPSTWALMIVGVGLMGYALRYSRRNDAVNAA